MKIKRFLHEKYSEIFVILIGLIFGSFLMFSTFGKEADSIYISSKSWSDFASHVPLIRSFSLGNNFPPEYPLFPDEPIKYHFIFYAAAGFLEKVGLPIDLALNIPSIIGFTLLLLMIFLIAKMLFKSRIVGILSVVFFLFNSSLSFIYYFKNNPLSINSLLEIPMITNFQSFAPYGNGIVSAFWNLNIYTNQRHLAISFAISLFIIFILLKPIFNKFEVRLRVYLFLGTLLGASFFLHMAVFLMTGIVILFLGLLFPKIRKSAFAILIIAGIIAIPQYLYLTSSLGFKMVLNPGFLIADKLTISNFSEFWIYNLGLSIVLIPLGFLLSDKKQRRVLLAFFSVFILGNLVQFSPEIAANHKFFNYFLLISNAYSAFFIFKLWNKKLIFKPIAFICILIMIFGGIIDFFPLYNDNKFKIEDYKINPNANWIYKNTSPDSVFVNSTFLYNPASLAGRKIFLGWPYFAWSQGYDTNKRGEELRKILGAKNKKIACSLLTKNNIDYIEIFIQNPPDENIPPISDVWEKDFTREYNLENYSIYKTLSNCN